MDRWQLRDLFNSQSYLDRAMSGHFNERVESESRCELASEPPGTRSQMVAYYDGRRKVAVAHRYQRPDGTLGASGWPDPHELLHGGVLYFNYDQRE